MRKLIVGLMMVVGLLAVTPPVMAQSLVVPGSADPVGLITSGAILPYLGQGLAVGGMSFLELYAPVQATTVHMFLFDVNCVRQGPSLQVDLTANDVELLRIDAFGSTPTSGLVLAGKTDAQGFTLRPWRPALGEAVAARTLWANANGNFVRVIDPIALATLDDTVPTGQGGWHPLRTAAAFFAPLETTDVHTTMYFVCPTSGIQRHVPTPGGAFTAANGFPIIFPYLLTPGAGPDRVPLRVRVYDDEEVLLRDVISGCNCLTIRPVTGIDTVYASASEAPDGTYTEVEGGTSGATAAVCSPTGQLESLIVPGARNPGNSCPGAPLGCAFPGEAGVGACTAQVVQTSAFVPGLGPFPFVAYRSITVPGFDIFNRVPGASICHIEGDGTATCTTGTSTSIPPNTGGR